MFGNRRLPMTSPDNSSHAWSFLHDAWFHCGVFVREWNQWVSRPFAIATGTMPIHFCAIRSLRFLFSLSTPSWRNQMTLSMTHLQPIVALIAGVLILIMPRLLNFIVAIYLILVGIIGLGIIK
jgi:hypothetical protein